VVAVPGLVRGAFPSTQARERWTSRAAVLPHALRGDAATLPEVEAWSAAGMKSFKDGMREHAGTEELRLGYVAFTRPRGLLLASGHWWGPTQKRPRGPSEFLEALREHCERGEGHGAVDAWAETPAEDAGNPVLARTVEHPWPLPLDPAAHRARREAAHLVLTAQAAGDGEDAGAEQDPGLSPEEQRLVASWDRDLDALSGELLRARSAVREVALPGSLSASQLVRLAADPDGFARELARPMPQQPRPAARRGTRFHAWVEARFEPLLLLEPDALPGADDAEIEDERDLARLKEAFLRSPYAERRPHRVEAPFQLLLGGRVVRGRIDAVYADPGGPYAYEVVDWKTGRDDSADPLQLAVYRLAWAEQAGIPVERVGAAFLYVRSGNVVRPEPLPGRAELERLLAGGPANGPAGTGDGASGP
jgi:DNA helicase-2/ATP-dependent DNA helicase PcrA